MQKPVITLIVILLTNVTAFSQTKKDSIPPVPSMTVTLSLEKWNAITDIILKSNVPAQQFLQAYNDIVVPFQSKLAELQSKQKKQ